MSPHLEKSEAPDINSLAKKFKFEEKIAEASELNFGIQLIPKIVKRNFILKYFKIQ